MTNERRVDLQLLVLLFVLALGGLYLIYAYNVFIDETLDTVHELEIELDEALAYGAMMTVAFSGYAIRLYRSRLRQRSAHFAEIAVAERESHTDALTGLPNRRHFDKALAQMLRDAGDRCDAVLMIDLNGFKPVNDRYGHAVGDELLTVVAARLATAVRGADLAARIGGDEFAVLAPGAGDTATARAIADRILTAFDQPVLAGGAVHRIGAGIGIAMSAGTMDAATLLAAADTALYDAKHSGVSTARVYDRAA